MGMGGQRHVLAALPLRKKAGTHCIEGWVGFRPVWMCAENLAPPTGIRSPDRPARSEGIPYRTKCFKFNVSEISPKF
jgi:hypothetical protein